MDSKDVMDRILAADKMIKDKEYNKKAWKIIGKH